MYVINYGWECNETYYFAYSWWNYDIDRKDDRGDGKEHEIEMSWRYNPIRNKFPICIANNFLYTMIPPVSFSAEIQLLFHLI